MGKVLQGAKTMSAFNSHRADARSKEVDMLRGSVASLQLKIDAAEKDVARARSAEERATSERERQENLMKLSRSRCETLEREMRSSASTARQAQQALVLMRRGIASLALASAISRGDDLVVAISFSRWRCLSHNAVC
uniref:Uncharacterized protein n=1 Tax=Haptolina ericina TaxID=156174 RepID=A0A7S3AWN7_9EUKA|mmetsp:Transcript_37118/g.84020  ORF Transcript_37118/g.84020 Transcript_37118/m.84020 type:complete len:137 (+) Transcript_37118:1216-1626(+)